MPPGGQAGRALPHAAAIRAGSTQSRVHGSPRKEFGVAAIPEASPIDALHQVEGHGRSGARGGATRGVAARQCPRLASCFADEAA